MHAKREEIRRGSNMLFLCLFFTTLYVLCTYKSKYTCVTEVTQQNVQCELYHTYSTSDKSVMRVCN